MSRGDTTDPTTLQPSEKWWDAVIKGDTSFKIDNDVLDKTQAEFQQLDADLKVKAAKHLHAELFRLDAQQGQAASWNIDTLQRVLDPLNDHEKFFLTVVRSALASRLEMSAADFVAGLLECRKQNALVVKMNEGGSIGSILILHCGCAPSFRSGHRVEHLTLFYRKLCESIAVQWGRSDTEPLPILAGVSGCGKTCIAVSLGGPGSVCVYARLSDLTFDPPLLPKDDPLVRNGRFVTAVVDLVKKMIPANEVLSNRTLVSKVPALTVAFDEVGDTEHLQHLRALSATRNLIATELYKHFQGMFDNVFVVAAGAMASLAANRAGTEPASHEIHNVSNAKDNDSLVCSILGKEASTLAKHSPALWTLLGNARMASVLLASVGDRSGVASYLRDVSLGQPHDAQREQRG